MMISDAFAPINVGNRRIVLTNITREDLESAVIVFCVEVLLSLPRVVCKRRDRHGAHHGNCQQRGHEFFDCFLHHDLRKSPFNLNIPKVSIRVLPCGADGLFLPPQWMVQLFSSVPSFHVCASGKARTPVQPVRSHRPLLYTEWYRPRRSRGVRSRRSRRRCW